MSIAVAVVILVLLAAVIAVVSHPLLVARRGSQPSAERSELEAARESKYREIRDAELDYATGKLSGEDFAIVEAGLRGEALEILRRLDALDEPERDGERSKSPRP